MLTDTSIWHAVALSLAIPGEGMSLLPRADFMGVLMVTITRWMNQHPFPLFDG